MSEMTPREHALRVAVLSTLTDEIKGAYKTAREEAQPVFKAAREDGQTQQKVLLPDGAEIGLISIRGGGTNVTADEGALTAWTAEHNPDGIEDYLIPQAVSNADVIALVKAYYPNAVASRVRAPVREALLKEAEQRGGYVVDGESGEKAKIAEIGEGKPTGVFSLRSASGAREKVIAAWRAGELADIGLGPLALPGGNDGP
jgi:hypothetical protein